MVKFQKITKEEWLKLSQEEKDFLTLEFNKSVEKRKKIGLYSTRGAAILCIFALLQIGYAQILAANNYGKIFDEYGPNANCYLCGLESLKKCECTYTTTTDYGNQRMEEVNKTELGLALANNNIQGCLSYEAFIAKQGKEAGFNFTLERPISGPKLSGAMNINLTI